MLSTIHSLAHYLYQVDFYFRFFFVYSYSHATYIDHGGVNFTQVSRPQSAQGGSLQAPLFALRPGLSQRKDDSYQGNDKGKRQRKA